MKNKSKKYYVVKSENGFIKKIPTIVGIVVCIILTPFLVMNLTIITKSYLNPDIVPDFLGLKPLIVLSGSMEPKIREGDLVISKTVDPSTLKEGDIVTFREGSAIITHRIVEVIERDGQAAFITKGDANKVNDGYLITSSQIEGVHVFSIGNIGYLAMFMQTPLGMVAFVGVPLCAFIFYDILHSNKKEKSNSN